MKLVRVARSSPAAEEHEEATHVNEAGIEKADPAMPREAELFVEELIHALPAQRLCSVKKAKTAVLALNVKLSEKSF